MCFCFTVMDAEAERVGDFRSEGARWARCGLAVRWPPFPSPVSLGGCPDSVCPCVLVCVHTGGDDEPGSRGPGGAPLRNAHKPGAAVNSRGASCCCLSGQGSPRMWHRTCSGDFSLKHTQKSARGVSYTDTWLHVRTWSRALQPDRTWSSHTECAPGGTRCPLQSLRYPRAGL